MRLAVSVALTVLLGIISRDTVAQQYTLALRPQENPADKPVVAALDVTGLLAGQSPNPFRYDCVAFLQVYDAAGQPMTLRRGPWTASGVSIYPDGRRSIRRRARLARVTVPDRNSLMVVLDPENSRERYVVEIRQAIVVVDTLTPTVDTLDLTSEPFEIPSDEMTRCGRVPEFDVEVLAPSEDQTGINVQWDVFQRGVLSSKAVWELFTEGSLNTSDTVVLTDALSAGGRFDLRITKAEDWKNWASIGVSARLDATENLDVIDQVLGLTVRWRIRLPGFDEVLRPLLRRFTPYPVLTLELSEVAHIRGKDQPELAGRDDLEIRGRAAIDWTVPLILNTTVRINLLADMFVDPPEGVNWFHLTRDISVEYPLTGAGDFAVILSSIGGRAAPIFQDVSQLLLGLGLRR